MEESREGMEEVWWLADVADSAAAKDRVIERSATLAELDFQLLAIFVIWHSETFSATETPFSSSSFVLNKFFCSQFPVAFSKPLLKPLLSFCLDFDFFDICIIKKIN